MFLKLTDTIASGVALDAPTVAIARAVLERLRKPSKAMIRNGVATLHEKSEYTDEQKMARIIFQAMIDAVLAEKP
jgi:hypothetical protein